LAFSADGKRISGQDTTDRIVTWDATTGRVLPDAAPAVLKAPRDGALSPDGSLRAMISEGQTKVVRLAEWRAARQRQQVEDQTFVERVTRPDPAYHRLQADLSEKSGKLFAAAFHLRRLLLIEPKNDTVRTRLAAVEARLREAAPNETPLPEKQPTKMPQAQ
jgi:hypothetical protein